VVDQVLNGNHSLFLWKLHRGGGDHVGLGQHWIFDAAAQRILREQLLQLQIVLRHDQVLQIGGDRALRAHHLNGRHSADLRLVFGVVERFLGVGQRFLLHANVFVGVDQIPIYVLDLVNRGDHLQAEGHIGNFPVVFGDADETRIGQGTEALQKILRYAELEVGRKRGAQKTGGIVGRKVRVVEGGRHRGAPLKSLRVAEISRVCVLRKNRDRAERAGGFRVVLVELQRARHLRIEAGNGRANAQSRTDQSVGARAGAAGRDGGAARAGADGAAQSPDSAARRILHDPGVDAENGCAGLGPQQVGLGDVQVIARDVNIEIVLQGERDRVVDGEIKFAVPHQRVDARRVAQVRLRQFRRQIRLQHARKRRAWNGVVLQVDELRLRRLRRQGRGCLLRAKRGRKHQKQCGGKIKPQADRENQTWYEHEYSPRSTANTD